MAHTYEELSKMTVVELRDIAKDVDHEAVQGATQMNKEHLLPALCKALGSRPMPITRRWASTSRRSSRRSASSRASAPGDQGQGITRDCVACGGASTASSAASASTRSRSPPAFCRRLRSNLSEQLAKARRQAWPGAGVFVLEEHEGVRPRRLAQPYTQRSERGVVVVLAPQPQIAPARGGNERRVDLLAALGHAQAAPRSRSAA